MKYCDHENLYVYGICLDKKLAAKCYENAPQHIAIQKRTCKPYHLCTPSVSQTTVWQHMLEANYEPAPYLLKKYMYRCIFLIPGLKRIVTYSISLLCARRALYTCLVVHKQCKCFLSLSATFKHKKL